MSDTDKAVSPAPMVAPDRRFKTVAVIACVAGLLAALLSLVGVFSRGELDLLYVLVFAGGMLVTVLGVRRLRKARKS